MDGNIIIYVKLFRAKLSTKGGPAWPKAFVSHRPFFFFPTFECVLKVCGRWTRENSYASDGSETPVTNLIHTGDQSGQFMGIRSPSVLEKRLIFSVGKSIEHTSKASRNGSNKVISFTQTKNKIKEGNISCPVLSLSWH